MPRRVFVSKHGTRNFLTFVNTTAIACHQNPEALVVFLPVCNSSRVYKRQKITSILYYTIRIAIIFLRGLPRTWSAKIQSSGWNDGASGRKVCCIEAGI